MRHIRNRLLGSVFADVAQLAEQPPCKRQVEGSSPSVSSFAVSFTRRSLDRPGANSRSRAEVGEWQNKGSEQKLGGVPKRSNGADCKSAGSCLRRFESCPHHGSGCAGVAQLARASAFQAEGRGFESRLPLWVGSPAGGPGRPRRRSGSSVVERFLGKEEVEGSIPSRSFRAITRASARTKRAADAIVQKTSGQEPRGETWQRQSLSVRSRT